MRVFKDHRSFRLLCSTPLVEKTIFEKNGPKTPKRQGKFRSVSLSQWKLVDDLDGTYTIHGRSLVRTVKVMVVGAPT